MGADESVRPLPSVRRQLPEEVAAYVRELIISGEVRPGDFLRMEPIAAAVGVSNTPVREGLLLLRTEGYLKLVPRRGFVVSAFDGQDVRDIFWSQARLAGELAARAARRITDEQLARLDELVVEFAEASAARAGEATFGRLGHEFHREVNLAAGSPRLASLLGSVVKQLPNSFYATIEGMVENSGDAHPRILETLRARDPEGARALMEQHILERADRLAAMIDARDFSGLARPAVPLDGTGEPASAVE